MSKIEITFKMKSLFSISIIPFLFFTQLFGQAKQKDYKKIEHFQQPSMKVVVNLIPEDNNKHLYVLEWIDTLGKFLNKPKSEYEKEINCCIRDSKGVVGFYQGLSSSFTHCPFQTTDSLVEVFFYINRNWQPYESGGIGVTDEIFCDMSEYKMITLPVKRIDSLQLVLENNNDILKLTFISKYALLTDPLGGCNYRALCLARYYISLQTGEIITGKRWLRKYGLKKMWNMGLVLFFPDKMYSDKKGNKFKGSDLIKKGKLMLFDFHEYEFENRFNLPY